MNNVTIDRDGCISCGQCWSTCPEFFVENVEDGKSQVVEKFQISGKLNEGATPPEHEECVNTAAENCPVQVIHVRPS